MLELIFASQNKNKLNEIAQKLGNNIRLKSLNDLGYYEPLDETGKTLHENALQKARFVYNRWGVNCFADDSGLEIEALSGEPGVHSAQYAGLPPNPAANIALVLNKLKGIQNRKARFITIFALILNNQEYIFEGTVNGIITTQPQGEQGFGYDPIFIPDGFNCTFAQMTIQQKNQISHRSQALNKMIEFLKTFN
jgi:XTP/dITP diphosphohydrolase